MQRRADARHCPAEKEFKSASRRNDRPATPDNVSPLPTVTYSAVTQVSKTRSAWRARPCLSPPPSPSPPFKRTRPIPDAARSRPRRTLPFEGDGTLRGYHRGSEPDPEPEPRGEREREGEANQAHRNSAVEEGTEAGGGERRKGRSPITNPLGVASRSIPARSIGVVSPPLSPLAFAGVSAADEVPR